MNSAGLNMKLNDSMLYPIGVVAKMFDISVATLRLYENEGLILPQKSKGRHRSYTKGDILRIACIRKMIIEKGINLAGIRMVLSVLPCWDIKNCSIEDRKNCAAYNNSEAPCWVVKNKDSVCGKEDCSLCPVYHLFADCENIKSVLKKYFHPASETNPS